MSTTMVFKALQWFASTLSLATTAGKTFEENSSDTSSHVKRKQFKVTISGFDLLLRYFQKVITPKEGVYLACRRRGLMVKEKLN